MGENMAGQRQGPDHDNHGREHLLPPDLSQKDQATIEEFLKDI